MLQNPSQLTNKAAQSFPENVFYHDIYTNGIHPDEVSAFDRYVKFYNN